MKTLKRILKIAICAISVYALHIALETVILTNIVAYLGYKIPIFI